MCRSPVASTRITGEQRCVSTSYPVCPAAALVMRLSRALLPALHAFAPSIIFISAGFDAADGDENNYGM